MDLRPFIIIQWFQAFMLHFQYLYLVRIRFIMIIFKAVIQYSSNIFSVVSTIVCLSIAPIFLEDETKKRKISTIEEEEEEEEDYEAAIIRNRASQAQSHLAAKIKKVQ